MNKKVEIIKKEMWIQKLCDYIRIWENKITATKDKNFLEKNNQLSNSFWLRTKQVSVQLIVNVGWIFQRKRKTHYFFWRYELHKFFFTPIQLLIHYALLNKFFDTHFSFDFVPNTTLITRHSREF